MSYILRKAVNLPLDSHSEAYDVSASILWDVDEPEGNQLLDAPHNLGSSLLLWVQTFQDIYLQKFITAVELILCLLKHKYKTINYCTSYSQEHFFEKQHDTCNVECSKAQVTFCESIGSQMGQNKSSEHDLKWGLGLQCVFGVMQRTFPKLHLLLSSCEKSEAPTLLGLLERAKLNHWST
jgi:hypothetical protein